MQAYTELIPPTAISHAIAAPFVSAASANLIVAKTSLLQVFEVKSLPIAGSSQINGESSGNQQDKLILIGEYAISGTITSLASAKIPSSRSGGHALLVAVKSAKFSIIQWDPEIHSISTVSIHYYEGEELRGSPWAVAQSGYTSQLTVDPSYRCAALKFGQRHLAILPLNNETDAGLDEYDSDLDAPRPESQRKPSMDEEPEKKQTPYGASFVLQMTALDPEILDPIDLAFLYEYREPTVGVLYSSRSPSSSLEAERKDVVTYAAFTLDLAQRARTPLLSIAGLPSDIFRIMALALPIGGTLFVGSNELVHIDQSGKIFAVAVNVFAKEQSTLAMTDQSHLNLKLDGCTINNMPLQPTELLLALASGDLAIISFDMDGRTLTSVSIYQVPAEQGGQCLGTEVSCAATLGPSTVFFGCPDADSVLASVEQPHRQLSRKRSHAHMLSGNGDRSDGEEDDEDEDEDDDDDDLYGENANAIKSSAAASSSRKTEAKFSICDRMQNLASLGEPVLAPRKRRRLGEHGEDFSLTGVSLQMVIPARSGRSGVLYFLGQEVELDMSDQLDVGKSQSTWSLLTQGTYGDFVVTTNTSNSTATSSIHAMTSSGAKLLRDTDFETEAQTLYMGVLGNGRRIVQITDSEFRSYDTDVKLSQASQMLDEESDSELKVRNASFLDPFLCAVRNDGSAIVWKVDDRGELEELDKSGIFKSAKWMSGSLHTWKAQGAEASLFMLSEKGGLFIFSLPNLDSPTYVAEDLCQMPQVLTPEQSFRRVPHPEALTELLVTDLGTASHSLPHLVVRNEVGDVEIYEPFHSDGKDIETIQPESLRWLRSSCAVAGDFEDGNDETPTQGQSQLQALPNVGGYHTVFVPSARPVLLFKEPSSTVKAVRLAETAIKTMSSSHSPLHPYDLLVTDSSGSVHTVQLPRDTAYGTTGWVLQRAPLQEDVEALAFHQHTGLYVTATTTAAPMNNELFEYWSMTDTTMRPVMPQSRLNLIHPDTWGVVSVAHFHNEGEQVMCLKAISLEASQSNKQRRTYIVAGTAICRGEDLPCLGGMYVFDIIEVAPDTNHAYPNTTRHKLKLVAHEEFRGPVTALCGTGNHGLVMAAQGQKLLVRGLREDIPGQLMPVAFMDMSSYMSSVQSLKGSNLSVVGDALKGVCLAGFEAAPYRLLALSKSRTLLSATVTDFLPHERQLFVIVADVQGTLQVLEYNPDNPKSLTGQRLLTKSSIQTGHKPQCSFLLPCPISLSPSMPTTPTKQPNGTDASDREEGEADDQPPPPLNQHMLLLPTASGALLSLVPLPEPTYRRLSALQAYLTSALSHPCAFNPRAYRTVDAEDLNYAGSAVDTGTGAGRGMVDVGVVGRWRELGLRGRREAWGRVGGAEDGVMGVSEVELLRGGLLAGVL